METKHTPGPWTAEPYGDNGRWEVNSDGKLPWKAIADIRCDHMGADAVNEAEAEANAKLIAAAPELLEACQAAFDLVYRIALKHRESMSQQEYTSTQEALLAAIAKATGQSVPA
jgi:hypothetical protein